jgi:hypothetical protein
MADCYPANWVEETAMKKLLILIAVAFAIAMTAGPEIALTLS